MRSLSLALGDPPWGVCERDVVTEAHHPDTFARRAGTLAHRFRTSQLPGWHVTPLEVWGVLAVILNGARARLVDAVRPRRPHGAGAQERQAPRGHVGLLLTAAALKARTPMDEGR